jgi:hypothetical protein
MSTSKLFQSTSLDLIRFIINQSALPLTLSEIIASLRKQGAYGGMGDAECRKAVQARLVELRNRGELVSRHNEKGVLEWSIKP